MAEQFITLTTDFGTASPFVAAMKGVILGINPAVRIIDLSHEIPPFDLRHAAFFLAESLPYFPQETLHVIVVDPGVGSSRAVLHVRVAGQRLLVPDNGCWTLLAQKNRRSPEVIRVTETRYCRHTISATFRGRDIFAPVAANLSLGLPPDQLGAPVSGWQKLDWPAPVIDAQGITGEVVFVDHFGNLITNISGASLPAGAQVRITLGSGIEVPRVRTYSDASVGTLVGLVSSSGFVEVAEVQGNASRRLALSVGAAVRVDWKS
jgi:S-adenosylmethionine hydrolase